MGGHFGHGDAMASTVPAEAHTETDIASEGGWGRACELRRPQRLHVSQQVGGVWRGAATKVAVGPMSELTPEQKLRAVQQVRSRRSGLAQES
jgi:hypothetical protein